jgi:hypothetical protein
MLKAKRTIRSGFSLVGLLAAVVIVLIAILAVGSILVNSHRGFSIMYGRIYSDVATDSYIAGKEFDAAMRKAADESIILDNEGYWVEAEYYSDGNCPLVDRYVRFYKSGTNLNVEHGQLHAGGAKETLSVNTVCRNVSDCTFKQVGKSIQMILTLDDGTQTNTVVSGAVLNN